MLGLQTCATTLFYTLLKMELRASCMLDKALSYSPSPSESWYKHYNIFAFPHVLFITRTNDWQKNDLREEWFCSAHDFSPPLWRRPGGVRGSWSVRHIAPWQIRWLRVRPEPEARPSNAHQLARQHLPKLSQPPQTASPAGDQGLKHESAGDISRCSRNSHSSVFVRKPAPGF